MTPAATLEPRIYRLSLPRAAGSIGFPVGDCEGQATMRTNLWIHFVHFHVQDTVVIMKEGNRPHPHCQTCEMFVPWAVLN